MGFPFLPSPPVLSEGYPFIRLEPFSESAYADPAFRAFASKKAAPMRFLPLQRSDSGEGLLCGTCLIPNGFRFHGLVTVSDFPAPEALGLFSYPGAHEVLTIGLFPSTGEPLLKSGLILSLPF